jgi:hypothetical protein
VFTGDAMHTQKRLSAQIVKKRRLCISRERKPRKFYENIQALFAPEYPKPGFGKIQIDFLTV